MKFKKFREDVKTPAKSHLPDVGLDLFMPEAFDIEPLETKTIGLGLGVAIPEGFCRNGSYLVLRLRQKDLSFRHR